MAGKKDETRIDAAIARADKLMQLHRARWSARIIPFPLRQPIIQVYAYNDGLNPDRQP